MSNSQAKAASKKAVLKSFSALSADDQEWVIRQQKREKETTALRARLPHFLRPFASNISVADPSIDNEVERRDGANYCSFDINETWVSLTISSLTSRGESLKKHLEIQCDIWGTSSRYGSGSVDSEKSVIFLSYYDAVDDKTEMSGEAYSATYNDPGEDMYGHSAKGVKEVVKEAVRDMGCSAELDNDACMKVLDAFMGSPGAHMLNHQIRKEASLRRVIRDGLEKGDDDIIGYNNFGNIFRPW